MSKKKNKKSMHDNNASTNTNNTPIIINSGVPPVNPLDAPFQNTKEIFGWIAENKKEDAIIDQNIATHVAHLSYIDQGFSQGRQAYKDGISIFDITEIPQDDNSVRMEHVRRLAGGWLFEEFYQRATKDKENWIASQKENPQ